ncbi:MAG: hypothetical protein COY81_05245 [Candidatus Pacebacteria bacterium CG_4_10_14_0_8_um_filter_43_12]|nr:MAG: hypothetical protein COY81_05245 [Candidatus Pacebacteria bacterium CG_4_10_14_0_8_um_filter_43_12]
MRKRLLFFVVGVVVCIIGISTYLLYTNKFNFSQIINPFGTRKTDLPRITNSPEALADESYWVWLQNPKVYKNADIYYLSGQVNSYRKSEVHVYLGPEQTQVGFAETNTLGENYDEFPNRFPTWTIETIPKIEVTTARSDLAIVKIYKQTPKIPEECNEDCQSSLNKILEYVVSNNAFYNGTERTDPLTEIGPAAQILMLLKE